MEIFYQTNKCQADHLTISIDMWVDRDKPYYEMHIKQGCYDSFQAGCQFSKDKPISAIGMDEINRLVDMGWFTKDKDQAMKARDAYERLPITHLTLHIGEQDGNA